MLFSANDFSDIPLEKISTNELTVIAIDISFPLVLFLSVLPGPTSR
jgi:hypothetical protein